MATVTAGAEATGVEMMGEPLAAAQSVLYRFLAEGFRPPDASRLAHLTDWIGVVRAACEELVDSGESDSVFDVVLLAQSLAAARALPLGDLQAEYTRLFVSGRPRTPCRLIESVQREGVLVGESAEDVASTYFRFGLEVTQQEPDNLAAELEFLAYLTGTAVEDGKEAERYRRARVRFLRDHLLAWGPSLATKIRDETVSPPFPELAMLLAWLLTCESPLAG